jgi:hypothetical protein
MCEGFPYKWADMRQDSSHGSDNGGAHFFVCVLRLTLCPPTSSEATVCTNLSTFSLILATLTHLPNAQRWACWFVTLPWRVGPWWGTKFLCNVLVAFISEWWFMISHVYFLSWKLYSFVVFLIVLILKDCLSIWWTNGIWAESLDLILFLDFLNFFVNMHLRISFARVQISKFLDLQIKSYGETKKLGEVWVGRACARANHRTGRWPTVARQPWPVVWQTIGCSSCDPPFFQFFNFLWLFFGVMRKFGDGPSISEEWVYSIPIFWTLPLHLGGWKLPFVMELGDFIFFQKKFGKIRIHQDWNITR